MNLYRSEDPALDAERYIMAQELREARLPKCDCCEGRIRDNEALHYVTKKLDIWLCLECIDEKMELIEVDQ